MQRRLVVTIDGPAGAGKSTVARRLAQELDYRLLDTGALYRAVALLARERGVAWDDGAGLAGICRDLDVEFRLVGDVNHLIVQGDDITTKIRTPEISGGASRVSALGPVRDGLLDLQRRLGAGGGVVVEGRDTGTVVFPGAQAKFFLTASAEVRARRRHDELVESGAEVSYDQVLSDQRERDRRDSDRAIAPLVQAPDAVVVDSSGVPLDEVIATMLAEVQKRERAAAD